MNTSPKLRLAALLLALFFGVFGIHRFYVGKWGTGLLQLLLTCTVIGIWFTYLWVLVDFITIACGIFEDKQHRRLTVWTN